MFVHIYFIFFSIRNGHCASQSSIVFVFYLLYSIGI